jgi:hypothetical protein
MNFLFCIEDKEKKLKMNEAGYIQISTVGQRRIKLGTARFKPLVPFRNGY